MSFLLYTLIAVFVFICIFMILLVLIQKGRGGGLASAFGGAGGNTAFGSKTGDVLTWATSVVFGVFLLLAIGLNLLVNHRHEQAQNAPLAPLAPRATQTPVTPADLEGRVNQVPPMTNAPAQPDPRTTPGPATDTPAPPALPTR